MTFRTAQEATQFLVAAGISQVAIGKRAQITQPTVSRILSGEHKDTKGAVLIALNEFASEIEAKHPPAQESQTQ